MRFFKGELTDRETKILGKLLLGEPVKSLPLSLIAKHMVIYRDGRIHVIRWATDQEPDISLIPWRFCGMVAREN